MALFRTSSVYLNLYNCVLISGTPGLDTKTIVNNTTGGFTSINCVTNNTGTVYTGTKQTGLIEIV